MLLAAARMGQHRLCTAQVKQEVIPGTVGVGRCPGSWEDIIGIIRQKTERDDRRNQLGPALHSLPSTLGHTWGRAQL